MYTLYFSGKMCICRIKFSQVKFYVWLHDFWCTFKKSCSQAFFILLTCCLCRVNEILYTWHKMMSNAADEQKKSMQTLCTQHDYKQSIKQNHNKCPSAWIFKRKLSSFFYIMSCCSLMMMRMMRKWDISWLILAPRLTLTLQKSNQASDKRESTI